MCVGVGGGVCGGGGEVALCGACPGRRASAAPHGAPSSAHPPPSTRPRAPPPPAQKHNVRDWLRVIASGKDRGAYELRYFNIADQEEEEEEDDE